MSPDNSSGNLTRDDLIRIANETLEAIEQGSYTLSPSQSTNNFSDVRTFDLGTNVEYLKANTSYYAPDSMLSTWSQSRPVQLRETKIWATEMSTLETARCLLKKLSTSNSDMRQVVERAQRVHSAVGVLNFASAKTPGGRFLVGSPAQEESIARSSTLYPSLMSSAGQQFYSVNHSAIASGSDGYYTHAMIYSPSVSVIRNDAGGWIPPYEIDVLTSPAVNAGIVRELQLHGKNPNPDESIALIRETMAERMARLLYLFELQGVQHLVLGSFGTGAFKNDVGMVVGLWAELLLDEGAGFRGSFETVVFGVLGHQTYAKFAERFGTAPLLA